MTLEVLFSDPHGRKYRRIAEQESPAFDAVLGVLNDAEALVRMENESSSGRPALAAIVGELEASEPIARVLRGDDKASRDRFKQAVGVSVRLAMEARGWRTTGKKGSLRGGSRWFTQAERYRRGAPDPAAAADRLRAGLDRLAGMGDEAERRETAEGLMRSLEATRRGEGRVF